MKTTLTIIFLFIIHSFSIAQNLDWVKQTGGNDRIFGTKIKRNHSGEILVLGYYYGTVDFDNGAGVDTLTSLGNSDIYIQKLDSVGNHLWVKNIGGISSDQGTDLSIDQDDNIYICGLFQGTAYFNSASAADSLVSFGSGDMFVLNLNTNGDFNWVKQLGGKKFERVASLQLDQNKNIYLTGSFEGTSDFDPSSVVDTAVSAGKEDIFIVKLDSTGNLKWYRTFGNTDSDQGADLAVDSSENLYITGIFKKLIDFDPGNGIDTLNAANGIFFLILLDSTGNKVWAKNYGGAAYGWVGSMVLDKDNNIYSGGFYGGNNDFDPGSGTTSLTANSSTNVFIQKLSKAGIFKWVVGTSSNTGSTVSELTTSDSGNVFSIGDFYSYTYFNTNAGGISANGGCDAFIWKLDTTGKNRWILPISGKGSEYGQSIVVDNLENIWSLGTFRDTTDFNPAARSNNLKSIGKNDVFVAKYGTCGLRTVTQPTNISSTPGSVANFTVSANSTSASLQWQVDSGSGFQNISNGGAFSGATNKDLYVTITSLSFNNYKFQCIATDGSCVDTSLVALLNVACVKLTNFALSNNTNKVVGYSGFLVRVIPKYYNTSYQWQADTGSGFYNLTNGGQYSGCNTDSLRIQIVTYAHNNYKFRCILSRSVCDDTTNYTTLKVKCPTFTTQPVAKTVAAGTDAWFKAKISGYNYTFNWQVDTGAGYKNLANNATYSGVNTDSLYIVGAIKNMNGNKYRCTRADSNCFSASDSAILTVTCSLSVSKQPVNQNLVYGSNALFYIVASRQTATFQWQKKIGATYSNLSNSGQYSGTDNDSLNITSVTTNQNNENYRCVISEWGCSDTSSAAKLNVRCGYSVTKSPRDTSIILGSDAAFSVTTNNASLQYQWQENTGAGYSNLSNGGYYSGANSNTLSISNPPITYNNYLYRCMLSDGSCLDSTVGVKLTVICSFKILSQPKSTSVYVDSSTYFSIQTSSNLLTYQWQVNTGSGYIDIQNNAIYSGATNDTLLITSVPLTYNNYQYRCIAKQSTCADTSKSASITVKCLLKIVSQPINSSVPATASTLFNISANIPSASYAWQLDSGSGFNYIQNTNLYQGVTSDTIQIINTQLNQNLYKFRCVVVSGSCSDTSQYAVLSVYCNLKIDSQPSNQNIDLPKVASFNVISKNAGASYQWQENKGAGFNDLAENSTYIGTKTNQLVIQNLTPSFNSYQYRCLLKEAGCDLISQAALLQTRCVLKISAQPINKTVKEDSATIFSINQNGINPLFQWQEDAGTSFIDLSDGTQFSGTQTNQLTIKKAALAQNNFHYRCLVSEAGCADTSDFAVINVIKKSGINNQYEKNKLYIYPNPAKDILTVQLTVPQKESNLYLLNVCGQILHEYQWKNETIKVLDLKGLPAGIYFVKIADQVVKFIKE